MNPTSILLPPRRPTPKMRTEIAERLVRKANERSAVIVPRLNRTLRPRPASTYMPRTLATLQQPTEPRMRS
jgi:hypothetical protein